MGDARQALGGFVLVVLLTLAVAEHAHAALLSSFPLPQSLRNADKIVAGPDGALWFTQERNGSQANVLGRITTGGTASAVALPAATKVEGIAAGTDGAVWYAGAGPDGALLGRATTDGVTETPLPGATVSAYGIVSGPDGALWFTADDRIGRRALDGAITFFDVPGALLVERIVVGPEGALWFLDSVADRIGRITTAGVVRHVALPRRFDAQDLAAGPDGAMWFTAFVGERIGRMTASGRVRTFALPYSPDSPDAITAGPDGAMWFARSLGLARITPGGEISELDIPEPEGNVYSFQEGLTTGPDGALWFTQQNDADDDIDNGATTSEIGRIDLAGSADQLLVARLADDGGPLRARRGRLLRVTFTVTRSASARLRLELGGRLRALRVVRAHAGSNSVTLRLPRKPGGYRLVLRANIPHQLASDSATVTVTR